MADEDIDQLLERGIHEAETNGGKSASPRSRRNEEKSSRRRKKHTRHPRDRSRSRSEGSRSPKRRSGRRSRSRSRSRRRRSRSSSYSRSRRRDRSSSRRKRRERSSSRNGKSRSSRSASKEADKNEITEMDPEDAMNSAEKAAEKEKLKEMMELTRDHRTVFVGQLQRKVTERSIQKAFKKIGKVENVLLIKDKFTNRSKGFAYVEMSNLEDVPKVLQLNGQVPEFQVFPIMVKASEAEKNFAAKKEASMIASSLMNSSGVSGSHPYPHHPEYAAISSMHASAAARIYCGNLHTNITEDDLRSVFQSFGEVLSVNINRDETGRSKGFGFIQFRTSEEANFALSKGNGLELAGNALKLGCVNENAAVPTQSSWKLDDDEGTGLQMNSQSRTALMAKLAGGSGAEFLPGGGNKKPNSASTASTSSSRISSAKLQSVEGTPSFCFVLKNMFDPATEKGQNWHVEIKEDVEDECEKFGKILHSYVEKDKPGGLVYILFNGVQSAKAAAEQMHGRWFNCRQILVRYLSSQEYIGMFPEARSAVQEARSSDK